ncbi:MAG TPA: hypothetical protein VFG04_07270 [Planctomycetaceae bacterium]|jgi:hypothetical protein|nr:hypothetical protein [Planctomycetaceae bacterium]
MADLNLPNDLVEFLRSKKKLKYKPEDCECGQVELLPIEQLKTELFAVKTEYDEDPHAFDMSSPEDGCYLVRGVSLLASCEFYEPLGVMIWLPEEQQFGFFDEEHMRLETFSKEVTWSEISNNFPRFANAGWGLGCPKIDDPEATVAIKPWDDYPYSNEWTCGALPDIAEWYDVSWDRRGDREGDRQVRHYERLTAHIERDGDDCVLICEWQKPEEDAEQEVVVRRPMSIQEWNSLADELQSGFWEAKELKPPGETDICWSLSGFKDYQFRSLNRFYETVPESTDPTQVLGKRLFALAGFEHQILS